MASRSQREDVAHYISSPLSHTDILRPTIIKYGDRQFRKMTALPDQPQGTDRYRYEEDTPPYPQAANEEIEDEPSCEGELEGLKDVVQLPNGQYEILLGIPSVFFKYIIGREGRARKSIEHDTKCCLKIPRQGQLGPIVIRGDTKRSLASAKQRIEVIVWSNRYKEGITHFVAIRLNHTSVMESFEAFKEDVLHKIKGVDENLFQIPQKLHLTLQVFYLFSSKEEVMAGQAIEESLQVAKFKLGSTSVMIHLKGLESMNDDYSQVNVIYAKVQLIDGSSRLQEFADTLKMELEARIPDYVERDTKRPCVKLHATLMNTKFRNVSEERGPNKRKKDVFDARKIMHHFADYDFGCVSLTEICLVKRGEYGSDGFYSCIQSFKLV